MLNGKRILALADHNYEELELWYPKFRLEEENAEVVVAARSAGRIEGKHGYPAVADVAIEDISDKGFDGLLIPGGFAPDKLRRLEKVKEIVRSFAYDSRLIASICHGGWIMASANVLTGRRVTGSLGIKDDMVNAGAKWVDAPLVVDRNFISAPGPEDLPHFAKALVSHLAMHDKD